MNNYVASDYFNFLQDAPLAIQNFSGFTRSHYC